MKSLLFLAVLTVTLLFTTIPVTAQKGKKPVKPAAATTSSDSIPAAKLNGARVFVKYSFVYYPSYKLVIITLVLFPDGSAFDYIDGKPLDEFTSDTVSTLVHPNRAGTWKETGNTLTLTFPKETRTLRKNRLGWFDGKDEIPKDRDYNIYYPVISPPRAKLFGEWKSKSLITLGTVGGSAPMVAAGSEGNWVFNADGTFNDSAEKFVSATTANMGEPFKTGGDMDSYDKSKKSSAGKWRIDGPLLTLEKDGVRTVHLAFILPYWSKDPKDTTLLIDGDRWERPENK